MRYASGLTGTNRRFFLKSLACLYFMPRLGSAQGLQSPHFCSPNLFSRDDAAEGCESLLDVSRIEFTKKFENNLALVIWDLSRSFQINFGFGYYTERSNRANARWCSEDLLPALDPQAPSAGTVLIGRRLLEKTLSQHNAGAAISAFCAHEAGHALQSKHRARAVFLNMDAAEIRYELCADFICGVYARRRRTRDPNYPVTIQAVTQYREGDEGLVPVSHGTPEMRALAIARGFEFARTSPVNGKPAVEAGTEFAVNLSL